MVSLERVADRACVRALRMVDPTFLDPTFLNPTFLNFSQLFSTFLNFSHSTFRNFFTTFSQLFESDFFFSGRGMSPGPVQKIWLQRTSREALESKLASTPTL